MKKSLVRVATLVSLQAGALFAQSLVGTWQGLMLVSQTPGGTLHVVFKISTAVGGALTGQMYSIDQGGQAAAPERHAKGFDGEDSHAVHRGYLYWKSEWRRELHHREVDH